MSDFYIRKYRSDDASQLKALFDSVGWEKDVPPDVLAKAMINATPRVLVAVHDNEIVGLVRSMDDGVWSANIDCCVVKAGYQRKGIGTALVKALLKELGDIKYINVSPDESANALFYEKIGFRLVPDGRLLKIERK